MKLEEKNKIFIEMIKENIEKIAKEKKFKIDNIKEDIPNISINFYVSNIWYNVTLKFNPENTTYDLIQSDKSWNKRKNLEILLWEISEYIWPQTKNLF